MWAGLVDSLHGNRAPPGRNHGPRLSDCHWRLTKHVGSNDNAVLVGQPQYRRPCYIGHPAASNALSVDQMFITVFFGSRQHISIQDLAVAAVVMTRGSSACLLQLENALSVALVPSKCSWVHSKGRSTILGMLQPRTRCLIERIGIGDCQRRSCAARAQSLGMSCWLDKHHTTELSLPINASIAPPSTDSARRISR